MINRFEISARSTMDFREQERSRTIIDNLGIAIAEISARDGLYVSENFAYYRMADMLGLDWLKLANPECVHFEDVDALRHTLESALIMSKSAETHARLMTADNAYRWSVARVDVMNTAPGLERYMLSVRDIDSSARRDMSIQAQAERYRLLVEETAVMTFDYDCEKDALTRSVFSRDGREDAYVSDYSKHIGAGASISPDSYSALRAAFAASRETPGSGAFELRAKYGGVEFRWHRISYVSVADDSGRVYRVVGRADDIEDEIVQLEELRERARHDETTKLLNRQTAQSMIEHELRAMRGRRLDAFFLIDIEDCQMDDIAHGNERDDARLVSVGESIRSLFRSDDIAGRFRDDAFVIYMRAFSDIELPLRKAEQLEAELLKRGVDSSIGVALVRGDVKSFGALLMRANRALSLAKIKREGKYVYDFDSR